MRARDFTTFLVIVVFLNNIQDLEAQPKKNSSDELQKMSFFRPEDAEEAKKVLNKILDCIEKWRPTIGEPCNSASEIKTKVEQLTKKYGDEIPASEHKEVLKLDCQLILKCSADRKCECSSPVNASSCNGKLIPEKNLNKNCDVELKEAVKLAKKLRDSATTGGLGIKKLGVTDRGSSNTGWSVSDPGQNFQYIILMTVIFFIGAP